MFAYMIFRNINIIVRTIFFGILFFLFGLYAWAMSYDHTGHDTWYAVSIVLALVGLVGVIYNMVIAPIVLNRELDIIQARQKPNRTQHLPE